MKERRGQSVFFALLEEIDVVFYLLKFEIEFFYVSIGFEALIAISSFQDGCYGYFFWEAEFNDKCKNQGYNENHVCNISNFSQIHHQAERKIITN